MNLKNGKIMILENAKPRLLEAKEKANKTKEKQEVRFLYHELLTNETIFSVFEWLFGNGIDFETEHREYLFVIYIKPKQTT